MKRVWHISDSHCRHMEFNIPEVDIVIHTGDCSNNKNPYVNEHEVRNFMEWYSVLPIKHKLYIPGNHDLSIEKGLIRKESYPEVLFLIDELANVEGVSIYGSPCTCSYGQGWAYMRKRNKMKVIWDNIPENISILAVHGPCKNILDITDDVDTGNIVRAGCKSLLNRVLEIEVKYMLHGHIHAYPSKGFFNFGTFSSPYFKTTFVNSACLDHDGNFYQGNIFNI